MCDAITVFFVVVSVTSDYARCHVSGKLRRKSLKILQTHGESKDSQQYVRLDQELSSLVDLQYNAQQVVELREADDLKYLGRICKYLHLCHKFHSENEKR